MAVYAITGKLGSGKGKGAMKIIRDYLREGKAVATNCDIFMEHMMPAQSRVPVVRIPDKPTIADLYAIGSGNRFVRFDPVVVSTDTEFRYSAPAPKLLPGFDEHHNGALVLDECASWLNTREFQDKGRKELLEWFIHARKYGWDVYFICQNISQIDKQIRDSMFEYTVRLTRLDRMKIPFVSLGLKIMTAGVSDGSMPRLHIGVIRLGCSPDGLVADRWFFRGDDLNDAYNTVQAFSDSYPHAIHSVLPSWHLQCKVGVPDGFIGPLRPVDSFELIQSRPAPPKPPYKHMNKLLIAALSFGAVLGAGFLHFAVPVVSPVAAAAAPVGPVYSDKVFGRGYYTFAGQVTVVLSDGRTLVPKAFRLSADGWEADIGGNLWVRGAE